MLIDMETPFYNVLEPSCGLGHISKKLIENGIDVTSHDLIDYGWDDAITGQNFLHRTEKWDGDDSLFNTSGIMCYSWFVWENGYTCKTELKLFN